MGIGFGLLFVGCAVENEIVQTPGDIVVVPSFLDFGTLPIGVSAARTFEVRNISTVDVRVDGASVTSGAFTLMDSPSGVLAPGEARTVTVVYTPVHAASDGVVSVYAKEVGGERVVLAGVGDDRHVDGFDDFRAPGGDSVDVIETGPDGATGAVVFELSGGVDVAFLLDTTQSMNTLVSAVGEELTEIARRLDASGADLTWGLGTFEDYGRSPWGSSGVDVRFRLHVPQTTDLTAVHDALAAVAIHEGQDAPESTMEALRQAVEGPGYDLDCDGTYDEGWDVAPAHTSAADPFGGGAAPLHRDPDVRGGFGFLPGSMPVVLYATNYELRDADDARYSTPGGCPEDAGAGHVVDAVNAAGGRLIGVAVNMSEESRAVLQMRALAEATGSYADLDGDGAVEPAVTVWTSSGTDFQERVVRSVEGLLAARRWERVYVTWEDPDGVIRRVDPTEWRDVRVGERLTLDVSVADVSAPAEVVFRLFGDGGVVLDERLLRVRRAAATRCGSSGSRA